MQRLLYRFVTLKYKWALPAHLTTTCKDQNVLYTRDNGGQFRCDNEHCPRIYDLIYRIYIAIYRLINIIRINIIDYPDHRTRKIWGLSTGERSNLMRIPFDRTWSASKKYSKAIKHSCSFVDNGAHGSTFHLPSCCEMKLKYSLEHFHNFAFSFDALLVTSSYILMYILEPMIVIIPKAHRWVNAPI